MNNQPLPNKLNLNYGIILGVILSLFTAYSYAIDNSMYFSYWMLAILLLSVPIFGLIAIISAKKKLGGFISFKESLKNYTITIALGLFISTLTSILVFNVIDTDFQKVVQQIQVEGLEKQKDRTLQAMYNRNTPEATIESTEQSFDNSIEQMQNGNQYVFVEQIKSFFKSVAAYLIFGLILSAIFKKKDPELRTH